MNFVDEQQETDGYSNEVADDVMEDIETTDEELSSEVEVRLEEANCYKALLRQPLFDGGR